MPSIWERAVAAYKAFREPYLVTDITDERDFSDFDARRLRYAIYWAFYENTAYRGIHTWAKRYKIEHGLYKYIRNLYNPSYRLIEFWKTHIWGGTLDPEAGGGKEQPSAIPILTENKRLRAAIAQLWQWSNWEVKKDQLTLYGAAFGDVGIKVVDNTDREKVYLQVIHPRMIQAVEVDDFGNVKGYTFEEERDDPGDSDRRVTYQEIAERDGDFVVYRTLKDGQPYPWNGIEAEWAEPYGFIPFVVIQHNDVGFDWGWSELHPIRSKVHEVDDLVSKLDDQIRKTVDAPWLFGGIDAPWLFGGIDAPTSQPETTKSTATTDRPEPGREEIPALYGEVGATAQPLVAPLDIVGTSEHINNLLEEIERDYPELQDDIWAAGSNASGRALRTARQRTEAKVRQRRPNYDNPLVRAHQMAVAIAGYRSYGEAFGGFGLDSYDQGDLDHNIAKRPVFAQDPLDDIEMDQEFWTAAKSAQDAGMPLSVFLKRKGWSEDEIAEVMEARDQQRQADDESAIVRNQGSSANALEVMGRAFRQQRGGSRGQPATEPGTGGGAEPETPPA